MRKLRGNRIAMIFQDPMMTLNPVLRIDTQMIEAMPRARARPTTRPRGRGRGRRWPGSASPVPTSASRPIRTSSPAACASASPSPSRLLNRPDLIIADEPTTALDVTIQAQILYEMQKLCRETGTALIWITHDLAVVAGLADEICVMYAGRIVERGRSTRCSTARSIPTPGPDRLGAEPQPARRAAALRSPA